MSNTSEVPSETSRRRQQPSGVRGRRSARRVAAPWPPVAHEVRFLTGAPAPVSSTCVTTSINDDQLAVRQKVNLVEAFCSKDKKGVELKAFIDFVLEDQSCKLRADLLGALLAPPQASPPASRNRSVIS